MVARFDDAGLTARIMYMTPELAEQLLRRNTSNRSINRRNLEKLKSELRNGLWKSNGETIKVSRSGKLLDGQHRLLAIVQTGIGVEIMLVEGLPDDCFDTIDGGSKRSPGDILTIHGESNSKHLAATLAFVAQYDAGAVPGRAGVANSTVIGLLEKYKGVRQSTQIIGNKAGLVPPAVLAGCHYIFSRFDKSEADEYVQDVMHGTNLEPGDPVHILRERLIRNSVGKAKLPRWEVAALVVKAWNARRDGVSPRYLRWRTDGEAPEPFPKAR